MMVTEMAVLTLTCAFAGGWLDGQLGSSPLLLMAGIVGGLALGMYRMLSALDALNHPPSDPTDHGPDPKHHP
ncbi:MAG: AtpZ/AtpI family protein [Myxococcota bacterium]